MQTHQPAAELAVRRRGRSDRVAPPRPSPAVEAGFALDRDTLLYLQRTAGNTTVAGLVLQATGSGIKAPPKKAPGRASKPATKPRPAVKPSKASGKTAKPAKAKAPAGPSQEELDKQARLGSTGALAGWASAAEANATERKVRGMWRIPLDGIPGGNADPAARDDTTESAADRAIAIVPAFLGRAPKSVEVLLHLHGFGIGYRTQQGKKPQGKFEWSGAGEGQVRDVAVDRMEGQLEESGRAMVGILPQGNLTSGFGKNFDSNAYITAVFDKLVTLKIWDAAPSSSGVVLSGHSGAGSTLASMLAPQLIRKGKDPEAAAPSNLREVVLFDSINSAHELESVTAWVIQSLNADLAAMKSMKQDGRLTYLETSMRLRGYHTHLYDTRYKALKTTIDQWFVDNRKALGGKGSPVPARMKANYLIKDADKSETRYESHERMVAHGDRMLDALSVLPPAEEQVAFMNRVLAAHIAQGAASFKQQGKEENPDLDDAQLADVPGTGVKMRSDAAAKAGELLVAANSDRKDVRLAAQVDLKAAQEKLAAEPEESPESPGVPQTSPKPAAAKIPAPKKKAEDLIPALEADVLLTDGLSAASGYRGRAHQERLWKSYFRDKYYPATRKMRAALPGGVHGDEAVTRMVSYIAGKIAPPGYSNHQAGVAIDFWQVRVKGHDIHNDTNADAIGLWKTTWFWAWLNQHAGEYGFLDFNKEPWHWALGRHG